MNTDILKIGDDVYALQKVSSQGLDMEREMKSYYDDRVEIHKRELDGTLAINIQEEWDSQVTHLRNIRNRENVEVSSNLYDRNIRYMSRIRQLVEIRIIEVAPLEIKGTVYAIKQYLLNTADDPALGTVELEMKRWINTHEAPMDTQVSILLKDTFSMKTTVAYSSVLNKMYMLDIKTPHTYSDSQLCTGNSEASVFWGLDDRALSLELSRVNLYSMTNQYYMWAGETWTIKKMVRQSVESYSIAEEGQWSR